MASTINGETTKPIPPSVAAAMKRGVPRALALAMGPKPRSQVKVG